MSSEAHLTQERPPGPNEPKRSALSTALGLAALMPLLVLRRYFARQAGTTERRRTVQPSDHSETPRAAPDVATGPVLFAVLGFFVFVGLSLVGLRAYYAWDVREPVVTPQRTFAEPRLQSDPSADLSRFQAVQRQQLSGYAWVDRREGLVRIPIDRAMDLIAARGAKAYEPLAPPAEPSPVRAPEKQP